DETKKSITASATPPEVKAMLGREEEKRKRHSTSLIFLIVYLLSLGIGFHLGTVMVYGGIFFMMLMVREKTFSNFELIVFTFGFAVIVADMTLHKQSNLTIIGLVILVILVLWTVMSKGRFALIASLLFFLGISVHLFLLIRSHMNPELDMVDPETWRALYAHLRREQYPPMNVFVRKASPLWQTGQFLRYFVDQFRILGDVKAGPLNIGVLSVVIPTALGLYGIGVNYLRERKTWVLNFTNLAVHTIGMIILLNFSDHEPRERDYFYGPGFYFFSLFIGIGASSMLLMLAGYLRESGRKIARVVIPVGLILIVFSILPARVHWFSHDRSDNWLARDYAYNMLTGCEPDAILITNGDNDTYPLWYIQTVEGYRRDVKVVNRMLLNTSWYVKQLKDQEPGVPIDLTDIEIERLRPVRDSRNGNIIWTYTRVLDHIVRTTNWKRPIYFGVTVPKEVWEMYSDYLEMQGMVRRLVAKKGRYMVNDYQMARNMRDIFEYRGVLTEDGKTETSLYKSIDVTTMYQNYSVATMQLAFNAGRKKEYPEAIDWAERSFAISPAFDWGRKELGIYYMHNRQYDKAIEYFKSQQVRDPDNCDFHLGVAAVYETMGDLDSALDVLALSSDVAIACRDIYTHGFNIAARLGRRTEAKEFVKKWVDLHPEDREMANFYADIDRILDEESARRDSTDSGVEEIPPAGQSR
ncbi:MAG: tetratricopeptide repeat protein, partial [Bacteroidales bacterium]|nr:tetratricopeptide repeat protein [Candidatus Latescibacterota bacterium]